jgi:hypothetical protein
VQRPGQAGGGILPAGKQHERAISFGAGFHHGYCPAAIRPI